MPRLRDYQEIVQRLGALLRRDWQMRRLGQVRSYPILAVSHTLAANRPWVFLTGGMHGEEPAGVEAALTWLERGPWRRWRVNWLVIPCINPFGWERNRRFNAQRRDINRQFRGPTDTPEAELLKRLVRGRRFLFSMEFHEDVEASGYYLYEAHRQGRLIGETVVRAVGRVIHLNRDPVIDGNATSGTGLIRRALSDEAMRRRRQWPMAYHLYRHCTDNVFGSETPIHIPLEQRVQAHHRALQSVLRKVLPRKR